MQRKRKIDEVEAKIEALKVQRVELTASIQKLTPGREDTVCLVLY